MGQAVLRLLLLYSAFSCALGQTTNLAAASSRTTPCSLLGLSAETKKQVTSADLFRAYDAQVRFIRTLHLVALMRGRGEADHKARVRPLELGAIIDLSSPNLLHITGVAPYKGNREVELTSDGERFGLLIPEDGRKVFLIGPVDSVAVSEKPEENLRPRSFLESLRWQHGAPGIEAIGEQNDSLGTRTLTVDVAPTEVTPTKRIDVAFDLEKGVVNSLTSYDSGGKKLLTTFYSDWRTATVSTGKVPPECYARRIVMVEPQQDYQLEFKVLDLTFNEPIAKSNFRVTPPRGVPVESVGLFGDRKAH